APPGADKAAPGDGRVDKPSAVAGRAAEETQPAGPATPAGGGAKKPPAAVAEAAPAPAPSGTGSPAPAATARQQQAAAAPQPPQEGVSVDSVDYDDQGNLALAGKAEPGSVVEPKIASGAAGSESLGKVRADEKGEWRLKVERPVAPGRYDLTVEERSPEGAPRSRIRLPFERADPIADFPAGAVVVVQPGNSLWRIARKIYGRGVRYTVIYAANRTQIGNPDLIFPGQIFTVPQENRPDRVPG
ncbi:MAG: LysM peptidoglycan-binding domain-containing protein, partial [Alphaproteobacteria bacterium]|nr:LysM peptidoglycan-binding domain-containing protein [Alphaproteobacteria bacterium]